MMKFIIMLLVFFLFGFFWVALTNKYLPTVLSDVNNKKYDERQTKMFVEIFAKTLVWVIYSNIIGLLLKIFGNTDLDRNILTRTFKHYPEGSNLVIIAILLLIFYYHTKKKYSA